jgi:long-chain acyl-CoA synthetase
VPQRSVVAQNWLVPNPRDMDSFIEVLRQARCTVFTGVNTVPRDDQVTYTKA